MPNKQIDINSDLGEGIGNDAAIMPYISSCNIACGGHAGNKETVQQTIDLASSEGVRIGAHPSFPDRENFGRKRIKIALKDLEKSLLEQIHFLEESVLAANQQLHHIKPHGALYNCALVDGELAQLLIEILKNNFPHCYLYAPFNSEMSKLGMKEGIKIRHEIFADRNYNPDLTLVSRNFENALIIGRENAIKHVMKIIEEGKVMTINGELVEIKAETICVHGDNPEAVAIAAAIHGTLKEKGYTIQ